MSSYVYKVVKTNEYGHMRSSSAPQGCGLRYYLNRWIVPTIPDSGIFVFAELNKAREWKRECGWGFGDYEILKCRYRGKLTKISRGCWWSRKSVAEFWKELRKTKDYTNGDRLPPGSYCVRSVFPIEKVV
jgi:hypothetical protein